MDITNTCSTHEIGPNGATSPILSLPPEILSYISCLVVQTSTKHKDLLYPACVCRYWRNVLLNASEFWKALVSCVNFERGNLRFLRLLLERSSPRTLELDLPVKLMPTTIITFRAHWCRIARVEVLVSPDTLVELHRVFQSSVMSSLYHLTIIVTMNATDGFTSSRLPPIPNTMLPVLRTLMAPLLCVDWFSVESLRHIHTGSVQSLKGFNGELEDFDRNPLKLLYDALSRCPYLEFLGIVSFTFVTRTIPPTIHLPHLRHLRIDESLEDIDKCELIVKTLRIPPTACLILCFDRYPYGPPESRLNAFLAALSLRPPVTAFVEIRFETGMFTLDADTLVTGADLDSFTFAASALAAHFASAPGVGVATLTLECIRPTVMHVDWPTLLPGFARAVRLVVRGLRARPLFDALASGGDGGGSGEEGAHGIVSQGDPHIPLCPALEEATYGWDSFDRDDEDETSSPQDLRSVVETIVPLLARRVELLSGRRLKHLILEEYSGEVAGASGGVALGATETDTVTQSDILAPLRRLVDGPVEYKRISGPIEYEE